jgi:flagellar biosynthesis/type III secretory pathway protein FliH
LLLVVAPDAAVARWCAKPIELGHPGFRLQPLVAGPEAIPVVSDPEVAGRDPELAVLSAMAHGREEVGPAIAEAVLSSAGGLEAERCRLYVDLAMSSLSEAARRALEALMKSGTYEYQTELVRQWVREGEEGLRKGREEGLRKGREEGRQEGFHEGELAAVLEVLDARGIPVDEASRQRLMACKELAQIKLWLRKAVSVQSVRELFESEPASKPSARKTGKRARGLSASRSRSKR